MPSYKHRNDTAMAELSSRERPGSVADRKTEMFSIFNVSDKYVRKGVSVRSAGCAMYRERNAAQTKYSLWWPAQWALYHTRQVTTPVTTPVTAARSSHLLTPTSVP